MNFNLAQFLETPKLKYEFLRLALDGSSRDRICLQNDFDNSFVCYNPENACAADRIIMSSYPLFHYPFAFMHTPRCAETDFNVADFLNLTSYEEDTQENLGFKFAPLGVVVREARDVKVGMKDHLPLLVISLYRSSRDNPLDPELICDLLQDKINVPPSYVLKSLTRVHVVYDLITKRFSGNAFYTPAGAHSSVQYPATFRDVCERMK